MEQIIQENTGLECKTCGFLFGRKDSISSFGLPGTSIACPHCGTRIVESTHQMLGFQVPLNRQSKCSMNSSCLCPNCISTSSNVTTGVGTFLPTSTADPRHFNEFNWAPSSQREYICHYSCKSALEILCQGLCLQYGIECTTRENLHNSDEFIISMKGNNSSIDQACDLIYQRFGPILRENSMNNNLDILNFVMPQTTSNYQNVAPAPYSPAIPSFQPKKQTASGSRFAFASDDNESHRSQVPNLQFPSFSSAPESDSLASYVDAMFASDFESDTLKSLIAGDDFTPSLSTGMGSAQSPFRPISSSRSLLEVEAPPKDSAVAKNDFVTASPSSFDFSRTDSASTPAQDTESQTVTTQQMSCPPDRVKLIIGSKGSIVKKIMQRTKTMINVHDCNNDDSLQYVEIKGFPSSISLAKKLIQGVIDVGPAYLDDHQISTPIRTPTNISSPESTPSKSAETMCIDIFCPSDKISIIIGSKGVIIKEISKRSNTQISISEESKEENEDDLRKIEIKGTRADIEVAKLLIQSVVQNGPSALHSTQSASTAPNGGDSNVNSSNAKITCEIPCPKEKVGAVIGSKGAVVRELIKTTNTVISVSDEVTSIPASSLYFLPNFCAAGCSVDVRIISVKGHNDDVSKAIQLIENILKSNNTPEDSNISEPAVPDPIQASSPVQVTETLICPLVRVGEIIGWRGAIVKNLCHQSGAKIVLIDDSSSPSNKHKIVEIKGTIEQVSVAKALVSEILNSRTRSKTPVGDEEGPFLQSLPCGVSIVMILKNKHIDTIHEIMAITSAHVSFEREKLEVKAPTNEHLQQCILKIQAIIDNVLKSESTSNIGLSINTSGVCNQDFVDCPFEKLYLFLGSRGAATFADLSARSGAQLVLTKPSPKPESNNPRKIIITGTVDAIVKAKNIVLELISSNKKSVLVAGPIDMQVKGHSIGPSNKVNIKDSDDDDNLEQHSFSGASDNDDDDDDDEDADYDYEEDDDYEGDSEDDVEGDDDSKNDDNDDNHDDDSEDEIVHISIPCPNDKVGLIIGSKGIVIKSMMNRSNAKILVTSDIQQGKSIRNVEISGTEKQVQDARAMVETVIKYGQEALDQSGDASLGLGIITKNILLSSEGVRVILINKASTLRLIQKESKASIMVGNKARVDDSGKKKSKISIKGTVDEVEAALALFQKSLAAHHVREAITEHIDSDNDSEYSIDVLSNRQVEHPSDEFVHQRRHSPSTISNPKTPGIQDMSDFIPEAAIKTQNSKDSKSSNRAATKSSRSNAKAASGSVSSRNSSAKSEVLICPLLRVGSLIGTRGSIVREIMRRTKTKIVVGDIPDPTSGQDYREVTIRGPTAGVTEAVRLVNSIIESGTKVLGI